MFDYFVIKDSSTIEIVYDLIARKLESIEKTISVQEVGRIMRDKDVSSLVILDSESRPEGGINRKGHSQKNLYF